MAKKKNAYRYSSAQKKAYWMGVGMSNIIHDNGDLLDHPDPKIRASVRAGYEANNRGDLSHMALKKKTVYSSKKK